METPPLPPQLPPSGPPPLSQQRDRAGHGLGLFLALVAAAAILITLAALPLLNWLTGRTAEPEERLRRPLPSAADLVPAPRPELPPPPQGTRPSGIEPVAVQPPAPRRPPAMAPVRVGDDVRPPRRTRDVRPVYPTVAQTARVEGIVVVELQIDPRGRVENVRVLRSVPLLDQAAVDAVRQWEFEPTRLDGAAVPVVMTVTIDFKLQ